MFGRAVGRKSAYDSEWTHGELHARYWADSVDQWPVGPRRLGMVLRPGPSHPAPAKTTGVILASSIQELRARYGFHYTPAVEYQYSVEGREYRGSRIRYGGPAVNGSHSDAERLLQAYPPGAAVTVFYRPSRPEDAVLVPGAAGSSRECRPRRLHRFLRRRPHCPCADAAPQTACRSGVAAGVLADTFTAAEFDICGVS